MINILNLEQPPYALPAPQNCSFLFSGATPVGSFIKRKRKGTAPSFQGTPTYKLFSKEDYSQEKFFLTCSADVRKYRKTQGAPGEGSGVRGSPPPGEALTTSG